jgi:Fe-S-cluster containining protein
VWFTDDEGEAMARSLNLSEAEFYQRFAHRIEGRWSLIERETRHGFDCVFLDRTSVPGKAVCSIYAARPLQCRTWPFWPEMLESRRQWTAYKHVTPCPGMNSGPLIPVEHIRIQRACMRG